MRTAGTRSCEETYAAAEHWEEEEVAENVATYFHMRLFC